MRKKLLTLARIVVYLLAFLSAPVLVGMLGFNAATSGTDARSHAATSGGAAATAAPPAHDPTKPTAVVLLSNQGSQVTDVLAPYEVLARSGAFNVYAVAPSQEAVPLVTVINRRGSGQLGGGLDVLPHLSLAELDRRLGGRDPDVIVVPATQGVGSPEHTPLAGWLREHARGGVTVLAVCNGAEVLADAGLLDGRRATANWAGIDGYEGRYPQVAWVRGLRYVEDGDVVTTAGVTSGVNGTLRVVAKVVGEAAANELARQIGYPDGRLGASPEIEANRLTVGDAALWLLHAAYGWGKPSVGVALTAGVGEIELASAFDAYPGQAFTANVTTLAPGGPGGTVRSAHGLAFVPRFGLDDAPELDRVLVPGRAAPAATDARLGAWARARGLAPEYVHADAPAGLAGSFPFDATLADLAARENVPVARFTAKALEYPTAHLALAGPGWPWSLLLRPLAVGLLGLALAAGLDRLLTRIVTARRRRTPGRGSGTGWQHRQKTPRQGAPSASRPGARRGTFGPVRRDGRPTSDALPTSGGHAYGLTHQRPGDGGQRVTGRDHAARSGAVAPRAGGLLRRHLGAGWHFARHLLEMVVAMLVGMAALGATVAALGAPPGYDRPVGMYAWMGAAMAAPMVAWMRRRGHAWADGLEMTAAMLVPLFAVVLPVELGVAGYVPGLSAQSLPMLAHAAMLVGMLVLMVYHRDRYTCGAHPHRA